MTEPVTLSADEGYAKYRGKCQEYCEAAILADPSLTLVRGYYYEPIWGTREEHWWTKRPDGTIYDPTRKQFPSKGMGAYEEFDGWFSCEECGKENQGRECGDVWQVSVLFLKHWKMVPYSIQKRVWINYRTGQCDDWQPSAEYCDAAQAAVLAVAKVEGKSLPPDHPALLLYDVFRP